MFGKLFQKSNQKGIGGKGEDVAARFLRKKGYTIIARNWYNKKGKRLGEVDVIARAKEGTIVFVEVKARTAPAQQHEGILPQEQITPAKLHKLNRIAQCYIEEQGIWNVSWRIDAVSVLFIAGERKPHVQHLESIFI